MKDWKAVAVSPNTSLETAISVMDKGGMGIVLVTDNDDVLHGTVTDGDVRRALLSHLTMETPVSEIMCATPRVAELHWSREKLLSVMESTRILQLPVVDVGRRVVGIETLHELLSNRRRDNVVFLMAGGFGTRLHPLTASCPKPLLKVGKKPILEIIIENFVRDGFHRFFISTHYLPEMIREHIGDGRRWGVSIEYVHEDDPLGTGGALGLLPRDLILEPIVMMNGDLLTNLDLNKLLDFHSSHDGIATMCVREYEHRVPYGVIESDGVHVTSMTEKPTFRHFINAGIYVLSPEILNNVTRGQCIDMPTILEQQMVEGRAVNMFPVHEYWLDIGRMEDFQRAQNEIAGLWNG